MGMRHLRQISSPLQAPDSAWWRQAVIEGMHCLRMCRIMASVNTVKADTGQQQQPPVEHGHTGCSPNGGVQC
jgi:hypothetical protein